MPLRTYDPGEVLVLIAAIPISGFSDGTFVRVERSSDAFTKIEGVDGIISRSPNTDRSGTVSITLSQTSPSNDFLYGLAIADELSNAGVVPIFIRDRSGRSIFVSGFGWIRKVPSMEYSKSDSNREWMIDAVNLNMFGGGNPIQT